MRVLLIEGARKGEKGIVRGAILPTMTVRLMDVAERYIRLAHAIDAHQEGFIDGYGGPPEWADRTLRPPAELLREAADLQQAVEDVPEAERRDWLRVQARAMHTLCRLLNGETLPFAEEVRGLYDVAPLTAGREELEQALKEYDHTLPGHGTLSERLEALRRRVEVPDEQVLAVAGPILDELRSRTRQRFGLPEGENFTIHLVRGKPWGGYNWPLGNLQSRIDINTDFPVVLAALPDLLAHEGYPGHHTEHATKEAELVRGLGWQEHQLQLINAPECVVSEGIATRALDMVMTRQEVDDWLTGELAQAARVHPDDVRALLAANRARENIRHVNGTAAHLLLAEGAPEQEVVDFLKRFNAVSEERARHTLNFIRQYRGYVYTYSVGHQLVGEHIQARGIQGRSTEGFRELLTRPRTPGQLGG